MKNMNSFRLSITPLSAPTRDAVYKKITFMKKNLRPSQALFPKEESNLYPKFRKLQFYPFKLFGSLGVPKIHPNDN